MKKIVNDLVQITSMVCGFIAFMAIIGAAGAFENNSIVEADLVRSIFKSFVVIGVSVIAFRIAGAKKVSE